MAPRVEPRNVKTEHIRLDHLSSSEKLLRDLMISRTLFCNFWIAKSVMASIRI